MVEREVQWLVNRKSAFFFLAELKSMESVVDQVEFLAPPRGAVHADDPTRIGRCPANVIFVALLVQPHVLGLEDAAARIISMKGLLADGV